MYIAFALSTMPIYARSDSGFDSSKNIDLIQPYFTNINVFYNDFNITNQGKAMLTSIVDARNVDRIRIEIYLQRYQNGRWNTVKSWETNQNGTLATLGENWYVASGYQYRMLSYAYVYKDGIIVDSTMFSSTTIIY